MEQNAGISTRERIFMAAVELFSKKGFNGVSVREITRSIGINEASLYNHYANKEALLQAIFERFKAASSGSAIFPEEELEERLAALGPLAFLQSTLAAYAQGMSSPVMNKIASILTIEQFANDEVRDLLYRELIEEPRRFYTKVFAHMVRQKLIRPADPDTLAREYLFYSVGVYYEYAILKRGDFAFEELVDLAQRHIDYFWNTIRI